GRIVEPVNNLEAGLLGEPLDCGPLPALTVLTLANVGGGRCTHITDRLNLIPLACHGFSLCCTVYLKKNSTTDRLAGQAKRTCRCRLEGRARRRWYFRSSTAC